MNAGNGVERVGTVPFFPWSGKCCVYGGSGNLLDFGILHCISFRATSRSILLFERHLPILLHALLLLLFPSQDIDCHLSHHFKELT